MAELDAKKQEAEELFCAGNARLEAGDGVGAAVAYLRAVEVWPGMYEAYCNGGVALRRVGLLERAVEMLRGAVGVRPGGKEGWCNLGMALDEVGRVEEAVGCYRRAIEIEPGYVAAYYNFGNALGRVKKWEEAVGVYREAVRLEPGLTKGWSNMGMALKEMGDVRGAIEAYGKAIELEPGLGEPRWNRALGHLLLGEWEKGWGEFEWRNRVEVPSERPMPGRRWEGEEIRGKRILVHWEMGLGDTMQFVRFVPRLKGEWGARVVVECQPELVELLRGMEGVEEVVGTRELPGYEVRCSMMSLPVVMGVKTEGELGSGGYLKVKGECVGRWKERMNSAKPPAAGKRVGLVWAGRPEHLRDGERSMKLEMLRELSEVEGVEFYSLQLGAAGRQVKETGMKIVDWTGELTSMAETGGLVANLDLVITVDTAVANLAGGMGVPVWVMLAKVPDWRWGMGREDSAWYGSARLFRQDVRGDWEGVVGRVKGELERFREMGSRGFAPAG